MIDTLDFYEYLHAKELDFFTGVPDSLLKEICSCITDKAGAGNNIIAANEGNAVAIAAGRFLADGKPCVVYMQNSGLGNAANPLLSLADPEVYGIPMLLMIGWRGEPGIKDEPQHVKQGKVTLPMLDSMDIPYLILDENYQSQIDRCTAFMKDHSRPIALIVRKDTFSEYKSPKPVNPYPLTREESLEAVLESLCDDDFIVSTTGKTSREIYELREKRHEGHSNDFLTVGSMGHTASIAFGMSLASKKNIYCIDGDGSFLMHTGGFPVIAKNASANFKYILINNGSHESVGGQPTVAFDIDIGKILLGAGFKHVYTAKNREEIKKYINEIKDKELAALVIFTRQGSRADLGRPKTTPAENKTALMKKIRS